MVSYKELGLVNTREMFKRAVAGGYAIPAFNFNTMEQMQAIVQAAVGKCLSTSDERDGFIVCLDVFACGKCHYGE